MFVFFIHVSSIFVKMFQLVTCSVLVVTGCAGCSEELKEGQALIAMDRQWHVWCFRCAACSAMLHGEYMGKCVRFSLSFPEFISALFPEPASGIWT
jgi:hypothetical protein